MTTLPEEAVKAVIGLPVSGPYLSKAEAVEIIEAALPFLPVQGAVKKLEETLRELITDQSEGEWDEKTIEKDVRKFSARILSALEPSAARELALEKAARAAENAALEYNLSECAGLADWAAFEAGQESGLKHAAAAIRALSSPDHADAGKLVEGDARADLERFWRPISEADRTITYEDTFNLGDGKSMTIRNSDHFWVRDADGRVYEATWSDHKAGYWWDLEGESPVDPVEYMPHPLSLPSAPSEGAE